MKIRVSLIVLLALVAVALLMSGSTLTSGQGSGESPPSETDELEEFVPSERVPADSAISFPVDI